MTTSWATFGATVVAVNTAPAATLAGLSSVADAGMPNGLLIYVISNDTYWRLDRLSVATPDGSTVIATSSGVGRWILIHGVGSAVTGPVTSASVAGLTALIDAPMTAGTMAQVTASGFNALWRLDRTTTLAADGVTVVATASGVGKWVLNSRYSGWVPVTECGAKGDGVTDDSAAFQNALNALAGTGVALWISAATYVIANVVTLPSQAIIWGTPGAVLKSTLTPTGGGYQHAVFFGQGVTASTTMLSATPTVGSTSLSVASASGITAGSTYIYVSRPDSFTIQMFKVLNVAGSVLTVDDPVQFAFQSGDTVGLLSSHLSDIVIGGNGLEISGTGDRAVEIIHAERCHASGITVSRRFGSFTGFCASFDNPGRDNTFDEFVVDGGGISQVGVALECQIRGRVTRSSVAYCNGALGGFNGFGYVLFAGADCDLSASSARNCGDGACLLPPTSSSITGPIRASVDGCTFESNTANGLRARGSQELAISATKAPFNTNDGFLFDTWGSNTAAAPGNTASLSACSADGSGNNAFESVGYTAGTNNYNNVLELAGCMGSGNAQSLIAVNFSGDVVRIDGLSGDDNAPGGNGVVFVNNGFCSLKSAHLRQTKNSSGNMFFLFAQNSSQLDADDVIIEHVAGTGATFAVLAGLATYNLTRVRTAGAISHGIYAANGVAATVRIGWGCDFTSSSMPIAFDAADGVNSSMQQGQGMYPDATATGSVTLSQVQAMASVMKLTGNLTGNLTYNIPANLPGLTYVVDASGVTLNGHTLTVVPTGGTMTGTLTAAQHTVYSDGTNSHIVV